MKWKSNKLCKGGQHKLKEYDNALTIDTPYYYVCEICSRLFQFGGRLPASRVFKRIGEQPKGVTHE